jgi:hypothetical protein
MQRDLERTGWCIAVFATFLAWVLAWPSPSSADQRSAAGVAATPTATPRPGTGGPPPLQGDQPLSGVAGAASTGGLLGEVAARYDTMGRNIEAQYAKLIQEAKDQKSALEDQIKQLEKQIQDLQNAAQQVERVEKKLQDLVPKIVGSFGKDAGNPFGGGRAVFGSSASGPLAAILQAELKNAGLALPSEKVNEIASGIVKGGPAGMSLALAITIQIAEASAGMPPGRRGPSEFPSATSAELSTAAALPASTAASYLEARFDGQSKAKLMLIDSQIKADEDKIKELKKQIPTLDAEIARLQAAKAKALADLATQKAKALKEALKQTPAAR